MFKTRLLSGIVLVAIALVTMGMGGYLLSGVLLVISLIAFRELTRALKITESDRFLIAPEVVGMLGITAYYLVMLLTDNMIYMMMCIVCFFMAEMFLYVFNFSKIDAKQVVITVFSFLYAPLMLSFLYMTREAENGFYLVWLSLLCSWGCDTCAYCVGKTIGKKKIFPVLSPKKSLEGCIGGVLGAAVLGGVYACFVVNPALQREVHLQFILICVVGAIMSMVGDLAASAIKRNNNIKDYGKLIPGHGGIMDRFDSVIVTAPFIYFLAVLFL